MNGLRFLGASLVLLVSAAATTGAEPEARAKSSVVLTILGTSDLHGHVEPWDYARAKPDPVGLARIATRVRAIRKESPNVLLLDAGDTIQGTPIEYLHARRGEGRKDKDPTIAAMNALGYDAMAVGNHEFNFGLQNLRRAQKDASFPFLSANTRLLDGKPAFAEFLVKVVGGVRVGILGLTTPNIPGWEPERNRPGLTWEDPAVTARRLVPLLRGKERCDVVVVTIHSGLEIDHLTGAPNGSATENRVAALAEVPGIDFILTGHTHRKIPLSRVKGVPFVQPGRWGEVLARVDLTLERSDGRWVTRDVKGELLPSGDDVASDPEVSRVAAAAHREAVAYLDEVIAQADDAFPAARARLEDTALLDLVNEAQIAATGAELSMTSLLAGRFEGLAKGPVKVRDVYALYPYENQLVAVEIDGATLKACLENAATFFETASWDGKKLVLEPRKGMMAYNYDVVQGASYRIDPTEPVGSRVKDLTVKGQPVTPERRFSLAVNGYRAQGAGGYDALRGAKVLKIVPGEIRDLLIERLRELGRLSPRVDHNWWIGPDAAWSKVAFGQDLTTSETSVETTVK